MKLLIRPWLAVAVCLWGGAATRAGSYLASDAPPRLRYQRPKPVVTTPLVLPPLALFDPVPVPVAPVSAAGPEGTVAPETRVAPESGSEPVGMVPGGLTTVIPGTPTHGATPSPPPGVAWVAGTLPGPGEAGGVMVTPQLLVPYFTSEEASRAALLVAEPVRFVPPQPAVRGTSQATYTRGR